MGAEWTEGHEDASSRFSQFFKRARGVSYRVVLGCTEGKKPLRRPRCRWKQTNKMDF